jgi:hypothetical protein
MCETSQTTAETVERNKENSNSILALTTSLIAGWPSFGHIQKCNYCETLQDTLGRLSASAVGLLLIDETTLGRNRQAVVVEASRDLTIEDFAPSG